MVFSTNNNMSKQNVPLTHPKKFVSNTDRGLSETPLANCLYGILNLCIDTSLDVELMHCKVVHKHLPKRATMAVLNIAVPGSYTHEDIGLQHKKKSVYISFLAMCQKHSN